MAKRKPVHALELGGTLFVPASHKNLDAILSGRKYPELRSVVIDFEDGLAGSDQPEALTRLGQTLERLQESRLLRFIRPRGPQMLKTVLQQNGIDRLDGFILPKFGLNNASEYLTLTDGHHFMPSIEGEELFDTRKLEELRNLLLPYQEHIICIRFGAQDMLRQLGLRQAGSIYDMLAPAQIVGNLIATFKPAGFEISAPVFPDFSDTEGFQKEISYELLNGLISKTIIHPDQIEPLNLLYRVTEQELQEAKALLSQQDGVINLEGKMGETSTQSPWAKQILERDKLFNVD